MIPRTSTDSVVVDASLLITRDRRLAQSSGHAARIEYIARSAPWPQATAREQFDRAEGRLHCLRMAKTVEIPDELHEALAARAKAEGVSVPDIVARELGVIGPKRQLDEIIDEVLAQPRVHLGSSTADIIRELRGPLPADDDDRH
jgi:hypothetical protein